jgi:hypothetical protein
MPDERSKASTEFRRMIMWIVLVGIAAVAAALAYLAATGDLTIHMVVATVLGVFFSVLLGCGLFAASFFSDKSGHDQSISDATKSERERE